MSWCCCRCLCLWRDWFHLKNGKRNFDDEVHQCDEIRSRKNCESNHAGPVGYHSSWRHVVDKCQFLSKKCAILGLFFVYFRLFKQTLQFLQQINVKKYQSSIQFWDSNSRPSENESPSLTTRPGLPPKWWLCLSCYFCVNFMRSKYVISFFKL